MSYAMPFKFKIPNYETMFIQELCLFHHHTNSTLLTRNLVSVIRITTSKCMSNNSKTIKCYGGAGLTISHNTLIFLS